MQLGNLLDESDYQKKIVPCVIKLFTCNDRATRSKLLQQMEHYIGGFRWENVKSLSFFCLFVFLCLVGHLQSATINDQIFPQIANGFLDTNPMIREQTIKVSSSNLKIESKNRL